jgi:CRP-like cAMP-binding protein
MRLRLGGEESMDFAEALTRAHLFKEMPKAQLKKLAAIAHEHSLGAGEEIFQEGEKGDEVYVIVMGTVRVLKKQADGDNEEVAKLGSGSYFGEIAFVAEDYVRTATIEAVEPTRLVALKRADVQKAIADDDTLGCHFYHAVARGLARRLTSTTKDEAFFKALALRHK